MAGFIERIIRRIEKYTTTTSQKPTIPNPGTNHVNDVWLSTDIYPGELFINATDGKLYTSDGNQVIELNREDSIVNGLVVESGTTSLTFNVSNGYIYMNGKLYEHSSNGDDVLTVANTGAYARIDAIYASAGTSTTLNGNLSVRLTVQTGYETGPILPYNNYDKILLALVYVPAGHDETSTDALYPLSYSLGVESTYPLKKITPEGFKSILTKNVNTWTGSHLFFENQIIYFGTTVTRATRTFVSSGDILDDIANNDLEEIPVAHTTGETNYGVNIGASGLGIYKQKTGSALEFYKLRSGSNALSYSYVGNMIMTTLNINDYSATSDNLWSAWKTSNYIDQQLSANANVINDNTVSLDTLWSSSKIQSEINAISSPINNNVTNTTTTWSSSKITSTFAIIDDSNTNFDNTWSSSKITTAANQIADAKISERIDDGVTSTTNLWSANQTNNAIIVATSNGLWRLTGNSTTTSSNFIGNTHSQILAFRTNNTQRMQIHATDARVKIGTGSPTARLHIAAGTSSANTAPIKIDYGTLLTAKERGVIEYDGDNFYMTMHDFRRGKVITSIDYVKTIASINTATMSNTDPTSTFTGIYLNVGVGDVWWIEVRLLVECVDGSAGWKFNWDVPTGVTILWGSYHYGGNAMFDPKAAGGTAQLPLSGGDTMTASGVTGKHIIIFNGYVTSSVSGVLSLRFAQNTSTSSNNTVYAESLITANRVN